MTTFHTALIPGSNTPVGPTSQLQTSAYGGVVPLLYGTQKITPNIVFMPWELQTCYARIDDGNIKWLAPVAAVIFALCEGPAAGVTWCWRGKRFFDSLDALRAMYYPGTTWAGTFDDGGAPQQLTFEFLSGGERLGIVWGGPWGVSFGSDFYPLTWGAWNDKFDDTEHSPLTYGPCPPQFQQDAYAFTAMVRCQGLFFDKLDAYKDKQWSDAFDSNNIGNTKDACLAAKLPEFRFVTSGLCVDAPGPGADARLNDIVRDFLGVRAWWPLEMVDLASLDHLQNTVFPTYGGADGTQCRGLLSPYLAESRPARDWLQQMLDTCMVTVTWSDGVLKFASVLPEGGDTAAAILDSGDLEPVDGGNCLRFERIAESETFNSTPVRYIDGKLLQATTNSYEDWNNATAYEENTAEVPDDHDIQRSAIVGNGVHGLRKAAVVDGTMLTKFQQARFLSHAKTQMSLNLRDIVRFRTSWRFMYLEPTDFVQLIDEQMGFNGIARIIDTEESEDGEYIDFTAWVWPYRVSPPSGSEPSGPPAGPLPGTMAPTIYWQAAQSPEAPRGQNGLTNGGALIVHGSGWSVYTYIGAHDLPPTWGATDVNDFFRPPVHDYLIINQKDATTFQIFDPASEYIYAGAGGALALCGFEEVPPAYPDNDYADAWFSESVTKWWMAGYLYLVDYPPDDYSGGDFIDVCHNSSYSLPDDGYSQTVASLSLWMTAGGLLEVWGDGLGGPCATSTTPIPTGQLCRLDAYFEIVGSTAAEACVFRLYLNGSQICEYVGPWSIHDDGPVTHVRFNPTTWSGGTMPETTFSYAADYLSAWVAQNFDTRGMSPLLAERAA